MTIDLANQSFDYVITGSSSDLECHKSNLFIYINSERYTLDKFYRIIIDTGVSKQITIKYRQYLTYKKNITSI